MKPYNIKNKEKNDVKWKIMKHDSQRLLLNNISGLIKKLWIRHKNKNDKSPQKKKKKILRFKKEIKT